MMDIKIELTEDMDRLNAFFEENDLEVTDEYLQECIECYREKYGTCVTIDDYYIMFIPSLQVGKIL